MATVSKWTPFGVALDVTATGSSVVRKSATQFTVLISASWETYYSGAQTNYGMSATSGGVTSTISAFNGTKRSSGSSSFTGTYSISGNGSATKTITVTFKNFNTDNGDSASKNVSFSVSVPAWTSYTVSYNANGGSGAPSSQTKWKDQTLTLSTTKPTRTGHSFLGWSTSKTGGTAYAAGGSYTANASVTLYAVWKANTYKVTYNANGGTGGPSSQTKVYGVTLALSTTVPTRDRYNFLGWSTSASATTATYTAGGSYTANSAATLYAVWEVAYVKPSIYNLSIDRCDSEGNLTDLGECAYIKFDWKTTEANPSIYITVVEAETTDKMVREGTSGSVAMILSATCSTDATCTVTVTVVDAIDSFTATILMNGTVFPIDVLAKGRGVSFGKPAELDDTADFAYEAKFNRPVYGKALGMDKLPSIPESSDLNEYLDPGCYAIHSNVISETCTNIPVTRAGRLEVWSSTGEGVRAEEYSYLRQRFIPYNSSNAVWERDITRGSDNVWTYGNWWRSSLTPAASARIYDEPVTLFTGSSSGAITLSQPADNFAYLEIFFTDNNGEKGGYTKLHAPYSAAIDLHIVEAGDGSNTYIRRTYYTIADTVMTPNTATAGYARLSGTAVSHTVGTNFIKITRVLGRNS